MSPPISMVVDEKAKKANILFWLFVVIFAITALFAFAFLGAVLWEPAAHENQALFGHLTWALLSGVLLEVAALTLALSKNLFGLSGEKEVATSKNVVAEIIDGLESSGDITEEKADALRSEYSRILGPASAPVRRS